MKTNRVFIGADPRQFVSYTVLQHSIVSRSSTPVQISPLVIQQLPLRRQGLTPFTYSRYLVPWLCEYQGWALFMDADMLVLDDISKLFALADDKYAVMVVKNPIKYEWPSVMLFNCAKCKTLTPEFVETTERLGEFSWLDPELVGSLPPEWNHLVGYDVNDNPASLVHFTQGNPIFPETSGCEYSAQWIEDWRGANSMTSWKEILGPSSHATLHKGRSMPKLRVDGAGPSGGSGARAVAPFGKVSDLLVNSFGRDYKKRVFDPDALDYRFGIFGIREFIASILAKLPHRT